MKQYYNVTKTLKDTLEEHSQVSVVTEGDIFDVDLNKQTIFPLSHIQVNQATMQGSTMVINVSVLAMDVVDESKDNPRSENEPFFGIDNEQDVLNTQLQVLNDVVSRMQRGNLMQDKYEVQGSPVCTPFTERFENKIAGWNCTMDILVPNTEISVC